MMQSKPNSIRIHLADVLAPRISTRVAIDALRRDLKLNEANEIILDFSNVESVSRSAAHELITLSFELKNSENKKVFFENILKDISQLFKTVTDNSINTKPKDRNVATERVAFDDLILMPC
jgi:anti-anti-sigma regulatory factor